jgi:CRISPR-associated protein Cas2
MPYLIAYDIAQPRRLRRIARLLERHAFRCQKSVFWFVGNFESLQKLFDQIATVIHPQHDIVQAWPVVSTTTAHGFFRGTPRLMTGSAVIIAGAQHQWVVTHAENPLSVDF